jgi:hypothetical protein
MIKPYELLARFSADGSVAGVSVRTITTVSGRDYEGDPTPLSGASDPAFAAFAEQFAASAVAERDAAISDRDAALQSVEAVRAELQAEIDRLTTLVPTPVPDGFAAADWPRFRTLILADPAVQRVAAGNPVLWPVVVLYLRELSEIPSRGADIAQLWTIMEQQTPVTTEEVARINAIATECGVPLQMNSDGSIS